MNNYSPNMLKTFDECQKKFYFKYIEKKSLPQRSTIFEKGKKIHALANYFLNEKNIEKMVRTLNADEKITWESLKANKYFQLNPVETEYSLTCKVDKYWVGGRLDAFMKDENNNYFILDYKTGQIPQNAELDFQTIVYLLCADKLLNKKGGYSSLKFVYIGLKNNVEKEIVLTPELKKQYEDKIIKTCCEIGFAIDSNIFKKCKMCQNCERCEYNKICGGI